jgi:hypothetical protein
MRIEQEQRTLEIARINLRAERSNLEQKVLITNQNQAKVKAELKTRVDSFKTVADQLRQLKLESNPRLSLKKSQTLDQSLQSIKEGVLNYKSRLSNINTEKQALIGKLTSASMKDDKINVEIKLLKSRAEKLAENINAEEMSIIKALDMGVKSFEDINLPQALSPVKAINFLDQELDLASTSLINNIQILPAIDFNQNEVIHKIKETGRELSDNNSLVVHSQWSENDRAGLEFTYKSSNGQEIKVSIEASNQKELVLQIDRNLSKQESQELRFAYQKAGFRIKQFSFLGQSGSEFKQERGK